jgi:hypothetical protein
MADMKKQDMTEAAEQLAWPASLTRPRSYGGTIENFGRALEDARRLHDPAPSTMHFNKE